MTKGEFKQVQVGGFLVEGTDHLIEVDCLHPDGVSYWEGGDWKVAKIDNLSFPSPRMRPHWYHVDDRTPAIDEEVIVLDELGVISFAHMVDPKVAVDYHGWNIPGVVFWRPCEFTEEIEEYYKQK